MRYALVVDDEVIITTLIREVLEHHDFEVRTAASAAEAQKTLRYFEPDIAVIDLHLGQGPSGFDVAHFIAEEHPYTALLLLSKFPATEFIGYGKADAPETATAISKDEIRNTASFIAAIELAISGNSITPRSSNESPLSALSKSNKDVVHLVAQGLSNKEIAAKRGTTISAVEQALTQIYQQLGISQLEGVNPRAEVMRIYIQAAGIPAREI